MANETGDNATLSPAQEALAEIKAEEAADNGAEPEKKPQAEYVEDEEEESPATADEGQGDDDKLADEPLTQLEDKEDDSEEETWELDPKIKEAIGDNAEALAAWERQSKGLIKKEKQIREQAQALETNSQGYEVYTKYVDGFNDPNTAGQYLSHLASTIAQQHGKTVPELLGLTTAQAETDDDDQWESEGEKRLARELRELRASIAGQQPAKVELDPADRAALQELQAERTRKQAEAQKGSWLNDNVQKIIAKAGREGFSVTKEMVSKAFDEDAKLLATDPVRAMKRAFPDEYANSVKPNKEKSKMPDLTRGGTGGKQDSTGPLEYTAAQALAELKAEND